MKKGAGHKLLSTNPDISKWKRQAPKDPYIKITNKTIETWLNSKHKKYQH